VSRRVFERIGKSAKPVTVCFLGLEAGDLPPNARPAATQMAAVEDAAGKAVEPDPAAERAAREASAALEPERKWIRGLYAGGPTR